VTKLGDTETNRSNI